MRRGMRGLALQVQEGLRRDPHGGDLFIFRGRRGDLAKIIWHDGVGLSLYGIVTLTFAEQPEVGNDPATQITLHFGRRCAGAIH
jgi:transposase